jgi:hypothetical protein
MFNAPIYDVYARHRIIQRYSALSDQKFETRERSWRSCRGHRSASLGQGGSTVLLEDVAAVKVTVPMEMIVDRGVDGGKPLEGLHVPALRHRPFSSPGRLV